MAVSTSAEPVTESDKGIKEEGLLEGVSKESQFHHLGSSAVYF